MISETVRIQGSDIDTIYHCVEVSSSRYWELDTRMRYWCYEQWGPGEYLTETPGWYFDGKRFMFHREEDMLLFKMRWG
jgi:hypothetical protein